MDQRKPSKNNDQPIQKYRFLVQTLFVVLCIWIGVEFHLFVRYLEAGGTVSYFNRPPGVDGFLPISSLMSVYYFLVTGTIHLAHPAGMFIFLAIVLMSLVIGKSFCSWLCPIGFLSELIGDFGEKIFKRKIKLPKFLDYLLRSLKYLLLGFFIYSIFFAMTSSAVKAFLDSPYNLIADIKMYYFFADISQFSLIVISILFILSIIVRNFWCRYLCPYGALLGIVSLLSPIKIRRNTATCIDCNLCAKTCMSNIKVDKVKIVISDECTGCLNCLDACPVADTLILQSVVPARKKISKKIAAIAVVVVFMTVTGIGMLTDNWQNKISKAEYLLHFNYLGSYGHPTGDEEFKKLNEQTLNQNGDNAIKPDKN